VSADKTSTKRKKEKKESPRSIETDDKKHINSEAERNGFMLFFIGSED